MAFSAEGLRKIAHGGAVTNGAGTKDLWLYCTNDADTVVEADGYFDGNGINAGDLILAALDLDGTAEVKIYVATGTAADTGLTAMLIV